MNPIQKESDLSKSEMLYSFKQIRLKRFGHFPAKKTNLYPTYYTFLYDMQKRHIKCLFWMSVVPVLLFLKGLRVAMASLRFKISSPLWCIYNTTTHPRYNTYDHSFVEYPLR